ncbi:MAG: AsmA-like C-terminal domain-containing protein [Hyphomicrobiaceae bacterium]|nr:AsmA-like C-terminal domain-containing protein [Hyphomicrobiaceae bacterium]
MSMAARAVSGGALVVVVALGFLYLRLMFGPIPLNFLSGPIEGAIAEELAGPRVRIESVALGLNDRGLLQFELNNVKVSDERGETLVAAPSVAVSLSRQALLRGRIAVESLDLMSARLLFFYADDGALSLKLSPGAGAGVVGPRPQAGQARQPGLAQPAPAASMAQEPEGAIGRIDLVKVLTEASARARRQEHASAYLREIGLRAATVVIDNGRQQTVWQVPELDVDLDHRRSRSSIAGRAKIDSNEGPWELTFRSSERVSAKVLNLTLSVQGLVPRGLASALPQLLALEAFDLPVSADVELELSNAGDILGGKIAIDAADGSVALLGPATPMHIASGHIELTYNASQRTFEIGPSELTSLEGRVRFAGAIAYATQQGADGPRWRFDIKSTDGWISADPKAPMRLPLDQLTAVGFLDPEQGRIVVDQVLMRAGGAEVSAQGDVSDIGGVITARLDGKIGAMPVGLFKALWPTWLAPQTRTWISRRLVGGDVNGGSFKLVRGADKLSNRSRPVSDADRLTFTLAGTNLDFALLEGVPALRASRGLLTIEGTNIEFSVPDATITTADGRKFSLKGSFAVDLGQAQPRQGKLALKGHGPLSLAMDVIKQQAPNMLQNAGIRLAGADGNLDGSVTIGIPLVPDMQLRDIAVEGKVRVSDARVPQALGPHDVQGINLAADLSSSAFEAKGKFLLGNVPATLTWQHVYGAVPEKQPPLRIAAVLFDAERDDLGLDLNDLVHGEVGVEVSVAQDAKGEPQVHLRADLANAELVLEALGWNKPVGKRAVFEFDFAKGTAYPIELQNVRLDGENVAVAGWMGMGPDLHVKEYRYPQFSLDVVSNFEAHGKLRSDNVWEVNAKGPTYDGRDLFKSFFFVPAERHKDRPGLDLHAEFDTVLGFFETSARNVRLTMQKRANKLNQLDMHASLAGGKQLEAVVRPEPGQPRLLIAKSNDAGQVFKLVGFLPHAVGGDLNLEVNIEGKGAFERTGMLTATRFYLLGDVVSSDASGGTGRRRRNVAREKVEFDVLNAPFSVGAGQFVLQDAHIDGPLVSATMSGRVDFKTRKVHIAGAFTPLAALNKILSDVPLVGDIVTGPKREGMFAWNYLLQGGLENPQIQVNPGSGLAPGFMREFFPVIPEETTPPPRKGTTRPESGARSSSSVVARPGAPDSVFPTAPDVSDGWISQPAKSGAAK